MNTPQADSAPNVQEQASPVDSPLDGQERGSQSNPDENKRVNGLMSLAQKRTAERDAALAEIEELKAMLNEASASMNDTAGESNPSQRDLMYGEPEPPAEPVDASEPRVVIDANMAPRHPRTPVQARGSSNPSARYLQDQSDLTALRRELNRQGQAWAHERGLTLD